MRKQIYSKAIAQSAATSRRSLGGMSGYQPSINGERQLNRAVFAHGQQISAMYRLKKFSQRRPLAHLVRMRSQRTGRYSRLRLLANPRLLSKKYALCERFYAREVLFTFAGNIGNLFGPLFKSGVAHSATERVESFKFSLGVRDQARAGIG